MMGDVGLSDTEVDALEESTDTVAMPPRSNRDGPRVDAIISTSCHTCWRYQPAASFSVASFALSGMRCAPSEGNAPRLYIYTAFSWVAPSFWFSSLPRGIFLLFSFSGNKKVNDVSRRRDTIHVPEGLKATRDFRVRVSAKQLSRRTLASHLCIGTGFGRIRKYHQEKKKTRKKPKIQVQVRTCIQLSIILVRVRRDPDDGVSRDFISKNNPMGEKKPKKRDGCPTCVTCDEILEKKKTHLRPVKPLEGRIFFSRDFCFFHSVSI